MIGVLHGTGYLECNGFVAESHAGECRGKPARRSGEGNRREIGSIGLEDRFVAGAGADAGRVALRPCSRGSGRPCRADDRYAQAADALRLDAVRYRMQWRMDQRGGCGHRRYAAGFRSVRARPGSDRRDRGARFQRRLGQRRHSAWPALAAAWIADHGGRDDNEPDAARHQRQHRSRRRLRVDVRFPAAVGEVALRAARRAGPRPSDLVGRSRRRCARRQLLGSRPHDRGARYRPAREIHLRDGRQRRSSGAGSECAAVGGSARTVAGRVAPDQSRHHRPGDGCPASPAEGCGAVGGAAARAGPGSACQLHADRGAAVDVRQNRGCQNRGCQDRWCQDR